MISIITTILFAVISAAVIFVMKNETNKKLKKVELLGNSDIEKDNLENNETEHDSVTPYSNSWKFYLIVVLITAVSALCGYILSLNFELVAVLIELGACYIAALAAATIDLKTRTIPNYIPLFLIFTRACVFVYELFYQKNAIQYLISSVIGGLICFAMLILANKISKGGIGGGDIKLLSAMGFVCGLYMVITTMLVALLVCSIVSIILVVLKKATAKDHLPFGPFIYVGIVVVYLFTLH